MAVNRILWLISRHLALTREVVVRNETVSLWEMNCSTTSGGMLPASVVAGAIWKREMDVLVGKMNMNHVAVAGFRDF